MLRTSGVDRASTNNVIAENMRRPPGVVQNLAAERGHQSSHVERRETKILTYLWRQNHRKEKYKGQQLNMTCRENPYDGTNQIISSLATKTY